MDLEKTNMVNEKIAALFLGVARQTIANWRSQKRGPIYHKLSRRVLYRVSDLEDFIQSCRINPLGNVNEC